MTKILKNILPFVFSVVVVLLLTNQSGAPQKSFTNAISYSGITERGSGGGVAWVDYDSDGYLDLFFQGHTSLKLYKNNTDDTFTDVTQFSGLNINSPVALAGFFGDYDNDGCQDLYVSHFGRLNISKPPGEPDKLYRNNCNGTFTDVTNRANIKDTFRSTGAAWADYDNDGDLDLYVANYGFGLDKNNFLFESNILYRNNGNGTFTNITEAAGVIGVAKCSKLPSKGWKESFQPVWFDYNNDSKIDLFVATDYGVSPLYHNNGDGTFTDVTERVGLCREGTGMGVAIGDYDNDVDVDIYVTNVYQNVLWNNQGDGNFQEVAEHAGIANNEAVTVSWGTVFLDYNNDGYLDLYVANGNVRNVQLLEKSVTSKRDRLYLNNGDGTFSDVASREGIYGDDPKLAVAIADYNNDGYPDIFVGSDYTRAYSDRGINRLYQNRGHSNNWLTVHLIGTKSNRDAVGAKITIISNGQKMTRTVTAGSSFMSQNSLWQTFGLGKAAVAEVVQIFWPSGITQILSNVEANQKITVREQ